MNIKVFDISDKITENTLDESQKQNILKIFEELTKKRDLITHCYIDVNSESYKSSPIYYFKECENKENFDLFKEFFDRTVISIDFATDNVYEIDNYDNYYISDVDKIISITLK